MNTNGEKTDELADISFRNLLKQFTEAADNQNNMIKNPNQNITQTASAIGTNNFTTISIDRNNDEDQTDYKILYQAAEFKCRNLEEKLHVLETQTIKELQAKVEKLERNVQQAQKMRDQINEIFACHQTTSTQLENIRMFVNRDNFRFEPVETVADKNDFHQQTLTLRSILIKENTEFLNRMEQLISKKRKRDQNSDDEDTEKDGII